MPEDKLLKIILEARKYAERIQLAADDNFFLDPDPDGDYWGNVGNAARIRDYLKEVSDILHNEGEYAS